jgi:hypothetical protein
MLTRTTLVRFARSAQRVLDRNAGKRPARMLAALLASLAMASAAMAGDTTAGVVRVSDAPPPSSQVTPAAAAYQAPASAPAPLPAAAPVPGLAADTSCSVCDPNAALRYGRGGNCGSCDNCRHGLLGSCGLFQCCHCGWRFLDAHCYSMTYAVSPWYCDPRDGRVYSAYGWGAPMTVPLAPTVTNQYNLGWGIPSGRLTPISRVAPRPGSLTAAVAPY